MCSCTVPTRHPNDDDDSLAGAGAIPGTWICSEEDPSTRGQDGTVWSYARCIEVSLRELCADVSVVLTMSTKGCIRDAECGDEVDEPFEVR